MTIYFFFRKEGFYPIELRNDADAIHNALCNPGTIKVERALDGEVVWSAKQEPKP